MKYGELFSGFGGAAIGAINRGYIPLWAIEQDENLAKVANRNFEHKTIVEDVLNVDPRSLEKVDLLHASPPCANGEGGSGRPTDADYARKIVEFAEVMKPYIITLENVKPYCKGDGYAVLKKGLVSNGYKIKAYDVNAAMFGVPQTRQRVTIVAGRDGLGHNLDHCYRYHSVGWQQAIDDLVPYLEDSPFSEWQLKLFKEYGFDPFLNSCMYAVDGKQSDTGRMPTIRWAHEPIFTIVPEVYKQPIRICVRYKHVVQLNARGVARLQSFPDSYRLSGRRQIDMRGLGDAMPPLMYERFLEGIFY